MRETTSTAVIRFPCEILLFLFLFLYLFGWFLIHTIFADSDTSLSPISSFADEDIKASQFHIRSKQRDWRDFMQIPTMSIIVFSIICFLFLRSPLASAAADDRPSAYEALQGFNLPMGLLPKGATGYELDESTGRFSAYLNGSSCKFSLEGSYQLNYKSTISGYITRNKLTKLSGIQVKVLFLWLSIVEVVRREDNLEFSVGIASASFSIDNFFVCPRCGCGLDCGDESLIKIVSKPSANSKWMSD